MFVLLNDLRRLRREVRLPRPIARGSLAVRHVDAGSCNGCEHELGAVMNPYHDLARFGLEVTASPRHADVLLVTGAITTRMVPALQRAYDAMPHPRMVAAFGDCALSVGVLGDDAELAGPLESIIPVDVRIPGCPPTPEQIIAALEPVLAGNAHLGH